jgi:S-adenosylmethionine synthetase
MKKDYLFSSESVSNGHPDKIADQISDAVLDEYLAEDENAKVACETLITENLIVISGEFKTKPIKKIDVEQIAKDVIKNIGYEARWGFDAEDCEFKTIIKEQSSEINMGVERSENEIGAGDQGIMFGYATNETPELMPMPIMLAHKLMIEHNRLRREEEFAFLGPDAKSQVSVRYIDNKPVCVENVVLSTLHCLSAGLEDVVESVRENLIYKIIPNNLRADNFKIFINPTGLFTEGGPKTDTGLTGRKIIVDTYGGSCPHGGGAFSGKDATKVDRSAAYMARYIAKSIVASGYADRCTIQLAYAIGVTKPVSVMIDLHDTGKIDEELLEKKVLDNFDISPAGIIKTLGLKKPIYLNTAAFGHFGREIFTWEKVKVF